MKQGKPIRKVLNAIREEDASCTIRAKDLMNLRAKNQVEFLAGRTAIQALLTTLPDKDWTIQYQMQDDDRALFYIHESSLKLLRDNPSILFMDCTYKINGYNMPLLDIVGVSPMNTTFYVGFGFLPNETQETYEFILSCLRGIYYQLSLPHPAIVVVDKDQGLINALKAIFPDINILLCIWHINKNILSHAKTSIYHYMACTMSARDPEFKHEIDKESDAILALWMKVVYALTIAEMEQAWNEFKDKYNDKTFKDVISYIQKEWLNDRTAKHFFYCYINEYLHFGNTATSQNEAAHRLLKRDIEGARGDLLLVVQSIERTLRNQHIRIEHELADERIKRPRHLLIPLFHDVLTEVSTFALSKTSSIYTRYLPIGEGKEPIKPCTGVVRKTLGIPCIHDIKRLHDSGQSLQMTNFHVHWHICPQNHDPFDTRLRVREPAVIRSRGRPPASSSTRRELSSFERTERAIDRQIRARRGGRRGGRTNGQYDGIPQVMTRVLQF
jgi:hypothetical protein